MPVIPVQIRARLPGRNEGFMEIVCNCGDTVTLIPHRLTFEWGWIGPVYFGEEWAGCTARNRCDQCPLNDNKNLLAKVVEEFGA